MIIATIFEARVIDGERPFHKVPRGLKRKVADLLIADELPELIDEDEYKPVPQEG